MKLTIFNALKSNVLRMKDYFSAPIYFSIASAVMEELYCLLILL